MAEGPPANASMVLDAATFAHELLTDSKEHSWLAMMDRHNATMTTEAWDQATGSGTMSHPWNAAPAELIPLHLMGLRNVAPAFRKVRIAPLPAPQVLHGSLHYPSLRGIFEVNVTQLPGAQSIEIAVSIPGNTQAEVCVPAYLFVHEVVPAPTSLPPVILTLDGATVSAEHIQQHGGILCVEDVGSGKHVLHATAAVTDLEGLLI